MFWLNADSTTRFFLDTSEEHISRADICHILQVICFSYWNYEADRRAHKQAQQIRNDAQSMLNSELSTKLSKEKLQDKKHLSE